MKLRRFLFITCIILSAVLFYSGLQILTNTDIGRKQISENERADYNPVQIKELDVTEKDQEEFPEQPVNLLLIGLDQEELRSDVIIILNMDPNTGEVNMLSVPRDTRVKVRGKFEKINALYAFGKETLLIKAMEQLSGLKIHYYVTLNFEGFRKIIDTLDGVEMDVPFSMNYDDPDQNLHIHLAKGKQILNGVKAEQFVRYRKGNRKNEGYEDGDIGRIKMQQEFVRELFKQKLKLRYISKADNIFIILRKYMKTNIEVGDIKLFIMDLKKITMEKINTFTTPGDSAYIDDLWYFIIDKQGTKKIIEENFAK